MKRAFRVHSVTSVAISAVALIAACGGEVVDESSLDNQATTRNHIMPMTAPGTRAIESAPAGAKLVYYGGPVLANVNVIPVYWNSSVAYQTNLNAFYAAVVNSTHYDMLKQYSNIGRGTRGTPYVDTRAGGALTDAQVQAELTTLINAGKIPAPNANNYYPVHFPSGTSITDSGGNKSCVVFCAYHGTYKLNGVNVNYGIVPDQGGSCAGGCGSNASRVNNLTSVSSHELVEATTDPGVGLATTYASPLAWYDKVNGEIGDICNAQQGTITGGDGLSYVVQKEFSNSAKNCVLQ